MAYIKLNALEKKEYQEIVLPAIRQATPGTVLFFRDFFTPLSRTASPRVARFLYEELKHGTSFSGMARLCGTRLADGIERI